MTVLWVDESGFALGDKLGHLGPWIQVGCKMKHYVSRGPKNYAFEIEKTEGELKKSVVKCRGITQNHTYAHIVNFEALKHGSRSQSAF